MKGLVGGDAVSISDGMTFATMLGLCLAIASEDVTKFVGAPNVEFSMGR